MADHGILFSTPMARALLAGTKTQTRRALSIRGHRSFSEFGPSDTRGYDWHFRDAEKRWHDYRAEDLLKRLPHVVGDRLWVREALQFCAQMDGTAPGKLSKGEPRIYVADRKLYEPACMMISAGRLRSGIHMPRWASRCTLTVTEVRVQRLQDISEADARAEGVTMILEDGPADAWFSGFRRTCDFTDGDMDGWHHNDARAAYRDLWHHINGPHAWAENPWVVAYSFTVRLGNIDQVEA